MGPLDSGDMLPLLLCCIADVPDGYSSKVQEWAKSSEGEAYCEMAVSGMMDPNKPESTALQLCSLWTWYADQHVEREAGRTTYRRWLKDCQDLLGNQSGSPKGGTQRSALGEMAYALCCVVRERCDARVLPFLTKAYGEVEPGPHGLDALPWMYWFSMLEKGLKHDDAISSA